MHLFSEFDSSVCIYFKKMEDSEPGLTAYPHTNMRIQIVVKMKSDSAAPERSCVKKLYLTVVNGYTAGKL